MGKKPIFSTFVCLQEVCMALVSQDIMIDACSDALINLAYLGS